MKKNLVDSYCKQFITKKNINSVLNTLNSSNLTQGKKILEFEKKLCSKFNSKYCTVTSSASTSLYILLKYLFFSDQKNTTRNILISNNTFVASANAAKLVGYNINFIDIDPLTGSTNYEILKKAIKSKKFKIFINTYYAGLSPDNVKIFNLCKKHSITYIEDACHAIGSRYLYKKKYFNIGSCAHSDFSIFSFHAVKNITSAEGGAVFTNNLKQKKDLDIFRNNGLKMIKSTNNMNEYDIKINSSNFRLSDLHASLGLSQLSEIDKRKKQRMRIYYEYCKYFDKWPELLDYIKFPKNSLDPFMHLFVIFIDFDRYKISKLIFQKILKDKYKIGTQVHYKPITKFTNFHKKNYDNRFIHSHTFFKKALSIPFHNGMNNSSIKFVSSKIINLLKVNLK